MFGYVTICKEKLSEEGFNTFRAYYCGLCKAIGKRCSHSARMGLSYDITFLAIILSAVYKSDDEIKRKRCFLHPWRKNSCVTNCAALDYAADAGVMLSYLKLVDDWYDDRSIKSLLAMPLFYFGMRKAKRRFPDIYNGIQTCLEKLSKLEKNGCRNIDETADCFAKILEILFTPEFIEDPSQRRILAWLGYNIGRWIYVMDAYNDIEKDIKHNNYNTFLKEYEGQNAIELKKALKEKLHVSMTFTLENAASAYELLDAVKNREVLDNIIYIALKNKQDSILGEENESL
ncbi:MAG: hypothetical protein J1F01_06330 [Oscillospiraceae bacterium]|nr:hypothetical protein [Oscillospiraceae bacterium]